MLVILIDLRLNIAGANDYAVLRRLQEMTLKAMPEGRSNPLWDTGQPFCRWVGVQCTPDGQVLALPLSAAQPFR